MFHKFIVDDIVRYNNIAGVEYEGKVAGTVVGYYDVTFPIILLRDIDSFGNKARVMHDSILDKID